MEKLFERSFQVPSSFESSEKVVLAFGSEMKNTISLYKNGVIYTSENFGNTFYYENFEKVKKIVEKLDFDIILCDKNPNFNISKLAKAISEGRRIEIIEIQHHIAHGYSVALENKIKDFASIVCDGNGFGDDSKVWGGEVFSFDERIGHLENQRLVGGDAANAEPARMLISILAKFMNIDEIKRVLPSFDSAMIEIVYRQNSKDYKIVESSSCGRILDCVSILLEFVQKNNYEGECAIELEKNSSLEYEHFIEPVIKESVLITTPLIKFIAENLNRIDRNKLGGFAHWYIAEGLYRIAKSASRKHIVFSGGCAFNKIIKNYLEEKEVLFNKEFSPGDSNISIGQIGHYLSKF